MKKSNIDEEDTSEEVKELLRKYKVEDEEDNSSNLPLARYSFKLVVSLLYLLFWLISSQTVYKILYIFGHGYSSEMEAFLALTPYFLPWILLGWINSLFFLILPAELLALALIIT